MEAVITIRQMRQEEAPLIQKIGRRAFHGMEALIVPKPREALVAERDGAAVGAVLYKCFKSGGQKVGYIDYAFIDPEYHGQGVGGVLYKAAVDFLWGRGCDAVTALVKDDNVGSWGLLLKNGFDRVSLPSLVGQFGLGGALAHYFKTPFCCGVGMDYYVALRNGPCPSGKEGCVKQLGAYFLANLLFLLAIASMGGRYLVSTLAAYVLLLAGGVAFAFLGTKFSKRDWVFRHCNGGALVGVFLIPGRSLFPMVGRWYPMQYENTPEFRRDLGLTALTEWLFVLVTTAIAVFSGAASPVVRILGQLGTLFLIFRVITLYPFESYGGLRIYRWNKWVYAAMAACSLAVVIAAFAG